MLDLRQPFGRALVLCVLAVAQAGGQQAPAPSNRFVAVDGHAMRVHVAGLDNRKAGRPIVVFEAGATNSLEVWSSILPQVAAIAPVVAYDRAGLGQSAWDDRPPTPQHVATRLRKLLQEIGATPLVTQSLADELAPFQRDWSRTRWI